MNNYLNSYTILSGVAVSSFVIKKICDKFNIFHKKTTKNICSSILSYTIFGTVSILSNDIMHTYTISKSEICKQFEDGVKKVSSIIIGRKIASNCKGILDNYLEE